MKFLFILSILLTCLFATIINVPVDQPTIQDGIDASVDGDTVLVFPGTYSENVYINNHAITLASWFLTTGNSDIINSTILSGGGNGSVITIEDIDNESQIVGFILRFGQNQYGGGIFCSNSNLSLTDLFINNNDVTSGGGGGIYCLNSDVTIHNCTISGNYSHDVGGGVYLKDCQSVTINNSSIIENESNFYAGGGIYVRNSNCTIIGSSINNNIAGVGGGISCRFNSTCELIDSEISFNFSNYYAGGVDCQSSSLSIFNSVINANELQSVVQPVAGGIFGNNQSNILLQNVIITGHYFSVNTDGVGPAILCEDVDTLTGYNLTVADNIGPHSAISIQGSSIGEFQQSIFWNDTPTQITGTNLSVTYSDIIDGEDGIGGQELIYENNISSDPLFSESSGEVFNLIFGSPCINTGNPDFDGDGIDWQIDIHDQDPDGTRMDMGALYFHHPPGCNDPNAINYNPFSFFDDGSCIYLDDIEPHFSTVWSGIPNNPMGFYIASATIDGIDLRVGDEIAIFDGEICVGHGQLESEIVPNLQIFASQDNPNTEEQDGFINGNEIQYRFWDASDQIELINVVADLAGGSEIFQSLGFSNASLSVNLILGCTDPSAINFDPEATTDDGSCILMIYGCIDETACNYNPAANTDDGSCLYFDCVNDCGGSAYLDDCGVCDDDSSNDNECVGCTDPLALNYDPLHIMEDGSCEYPGMGDINMDGVLNVLDIVMLVQHILGEFDYIFYMDFNEDSYINIIDIVILVDVILNPELIGCTDSEAVNWEPSAIYDDGSCIYGILGDVDSSSSLDIFDVILIVEFLLDYHYDIYGDMNMDSVLDVLDIVILVNMILEQY